MKIAIIDDLRTECELLSEYIRRYCADHQLDAEITLFESGSHFLECFAPHTYDLIFLDIYMDGLNGIETAEKIRKTDTDCLLIFSTTSQFHAVKGFRVRAFDYLVKPYSYEVFEETMRYCDETLFKQSRYIEVKEGRTHVKIFLKDIVYTDYSNHYIYIHSKQRIVKCYMPFSDFSALLLPYPQFVNCYRNCIVNMDEVDVLDEKDFVMLSGERVPINRSLRTEIRQRYANYEFDKLNRRL